MAATLPAIHPMGENKMTQSPIQHHHIPSAPSRTKSGTSHIHIVASKKRSQGRKEREIELKQEGLRSEQPDLNKIQTAQYRHTYKHNLCLDMLQEGFHKSFAELFALLRQQNEERQIAGPESVLWTQVLLEDEQDKLDILKANLTKAEAALRREDFSEVYHCQYDLARYFQQTGDKWLADHFFENCLLTASGVKGDEGRMAAEGHCNVGLALEESADYFAAAENFELFHKLCEEKEDWALEDGEPMHYKASSHLARIYTTIAIKIDNSGDMQTALSYLEKANDMAWKSRDHKLEAESCYKVGVAYEKNGNSPTALKYLNKYLEICSSLGDNEGYGKACEAIAKSYESQGKVEESIKYLEMFVEVAEKTKNDKATSRACSNLGAMFNSLGRYDQAVEYFNKSYNISRAMNDTETISSSRVLFGVAAAHKMLENFSKHVELGNRLCAERIIEWKDNRGDEFEKPIPEAVSEEKKEDEKDVATEKPAENEAEETENKKDEDTEASEQNKTNPSSDDQNEDTKPSDTDQQETKPTETGDEQS